MNATTHASTLPTRTGQYVRSAVAMVPYQSPAERIDAAIRMGAGEMRSTEVRRGFFARLFR